MQTSLSRRQRRRRLNDKRRPRGSGAAKYVALAIPLLLFTTIALLGVAGATTVVAGYSFLAKDLPDPKKTLEAIEFDQQTAVWDRTGDVLLARLGSDRREVVTFDQIPPVLVDATTAIEDKTFWENSGFDPAAFVSAAVDTLQGNDRGGSTITQQLVRSRLLPEEFVGAGVDRYQKKLREIIQSIRLTEAYPGREGKQLIMESYLNNNFYGNRSYGVAAAAQSYWKKDLKDLTLAQYAILAGIPKSPTAYDLVQNATEEEYKDETGKVLTRLVVPQTAQVVRRRNQILELMKTRSDLTSGTYTDADFEAAKAEPVILADQATDAWRAPHFVWQVRKELGELLCGEPQCEKIDTGGYKVITSLDYRMQRIAEKWVYAAAIIPNSKNPDQQLKARQIPRKEWSWIKGLRGHNIHNAAAGVVDYRHGRDPRLRRVGVLHGQGLQEDAAPVRRPRRRLAAAGLVDQAAGLPRRHRRQDDDRVHHVHGRGHQLRSQRREGVHPDPGGQRRARSRAAAQRAPVLAQHARDQGRLHQRPGAPVRAHQGLRHRLPEDRDSRWPPRASGRSRCTRST